LKKTAIRGNKSGGGAGLDRCEQKDGDAGARQREPMGDMIKENLCEDGIADDQFSFTSNQAGTYSYFCSVHPMRTGRVIVK
jgi:plastocyanin